MNLDTMLPSKVKGALYTHAYQALLKARLNYRGEPVYRVTDLLEDMKSMCREVTPNLSNTAHAEFQRAFEEYDRKHPIGWDFEQQKGFRDINGQRKTYRP